MDETYEQQLTAVAATVRLRAEPLNLYPALAFFAFAVAGLVGCWFSINVTGPFLAGLF